MISVAALVYNKREPSQGHTMGKHAVRFRCHHCLHCCTEVVCLPTPYDVIRIVRETGENPYRFLEFLQPDELTGVAKNDPTWLRVGKERFMMALRRDTKCFFLDKRTRRCRIYEVRPILCRLYPFKLHETHDGAFKAFTLHSDVDCPRHRDGVAHTQALYDLYLEDSRHQQDYTDLVAVFNQRDYAGKKPQDFIRMFIDDIEDG